MKLNNTLKNITVIISIVGIFSIYLTEIQKYEGE